MSGTSLDQVARQITHRVWHAVTSRPEQALLHTGYFVAVERAVLELLASRFTPAMATREGNEILSWADHHESEGFEGRMTEDIIEVLNLPLRRSPALALVAVDIPLAIRVAMSSHLS